MTAHPLHLAWRNIKARCLRKNHPYYKNYGGRGIGVSPEWVDSAESFMKYCLAGGWFVGCDIDRKNNDHGYFPGNIRYVSRSVNINNSRRLRANNTTGYRGVTMCRDRYVANCKVNGHKPLSKGGFLSAYDAAVYRDCFCLENGINTPLNFPIADRGDNGRADGAANG
jgi:hypothetical protein